MKFASDLEKRAVILLWCVAVTLFLWSFTISSKPDPDFFQFMNFAALIYGGGLGYHVVTELIVCPYTRENSHKWIAIRNVLLTVFIGYLIIAATVAIGRMIDNGLGWLIAFVGVIVGMFWSMHFLFKLEKPIRDLVSPSNVQ